MLGIVDTALIRKCVEDISYIYPTKGKMFYFYPGEGDNVVFVKVSRELSVEKYKVLFILPLESLSNKINENDEKIIVDYVEKEDNFYGDKFYAYDYSERKLIFDVTDGLTIGRTWWYLHPSDIKGTTFLTYYPTVLKGETLNKLALIEKKSEILAILAGQIMGRFLMKPEKVTEFGATIAYLGGCIIDQVEPKKEDWVKLIEYITPGYKEKPEVRKLGISTKRLDEIMEKRSKKSIVVQENKPNTALYLSELIKGKSIPFSIVPTTYIVDEYIKKQLNCNIKSVQAVRGGLHFAINDTELFKAGKAGTVLSEIRNLTGFSDISIAFTTDDI